MRKIGQEIRFEQTLHFLEKELLVIGRNPTQDKIDSVMPKFKELDKSIAKIEQAMISDKKLNKGDVKIKINNYKEQRDMLLKTLEQCKLTIQKKELLHNSQTPYGQGSLGNYRMLDELGGKTQQINRDFEETAGIIKNTKDEVVIQRQKINELEEEWHTADAQLTVTEQFMKMLGNRSLLTKLILAFLVLFLGMADFAILVMKVM